MGVDYGQGPVYPMWVQLFGTSGEVVGRELLVGSPGFMKGGELTAQWLRDDSQPTSAGWRVVVSDHYGNRVQVYWDGRGTSGVVPLESPVPIAGVTVAGVELSEPVSAAGSAVAAAGVVEPSSVPRPVGHLRAGVVVGATALVVLVLRWRLNKWRKSIAKREGKHSNA